MKEQLELIKVNALAALEAAATPAALDEVRVKWLGKKGELTAVLKMMGKLSPEERPVMGQLANDVRAALEAGTLTQERYEHFLNLDAEIAELERRNEKRQMTLERVNRREKRHMLRNREDREDHRRNMNPHRRQYYNE